MTLTMLGSWSAGLHADPLNPTDSFRSQIMSVLWGSMIERLKCASRGGSGRTTKQFQFSTNDHARRLLAESNDSVIDDRGLERGRSIY